MTSSADSARATAASTATFCATLVDEWVACGLRHAVVAPGSRSTPLALALADHGGLEVHVFHDERSAAFAALGIGIASGEPAILLCTSGTAAAHFHAAVIEAHLSDVPMVVCTADRPPELRDVGAPQTIDQTKLFGDAVRWFHDPGVASFDASHTWRSLAARCVDIATGQRPGPVHLNLPFREPLVGDVAELPPARSGAWSQTIYPSMPAPSDLGDVARLVSGVRGVIVAGRGSEPEVLDLARALGWPVLADAVSGLRDCDPSVVVAFDAILRSSAAASRLAADVVVRVGAPPASKVLSQWLTATGAPLVQVSPTESVVDPDHRVRHRVVGSVSEVCRLLARSVEAVSDEWLGLWSTAETAAQTAISTWCAKNWSEQTAARTVTDSMARGSRLVVSSSMPIRDVEWFGTVTPGVVVSSNRGANGIDGVVSTAVGVALASGKPTVLLIGDVALLHDSNGLVGLASRGVDLSVVVTNNDGGSIFSFLPQATQVSHETFEKIYGTPHGVSFAHLAAAHGLRHVDVSDTAGLAQAVRQGGPVLIEARFDRGANVASHEACSTAVTAAVESALSL
ncbi:MAG: 2-succinyl-5-enolpyruvyl-6-hydroxy-3-cyclohexene-1-carboxylic-acid synthase [Ilumatobacteraceae bacterium]